jgi:catechol 2,3-dioxygenase-like lactoylglutathione lyase family enzyme
MWGKPPFSIPDNYAIDVRSLAGLREWYKEKLGLQEASTDRQEDSGRPFADLHISNDDTFLSLVELPSGATAEKRHVIFYAKHLEKAEKWFVGRGVIVEPITTDSGGNRLFRFHDLEGNTIEVCVEPG